MSAPRALRDGVVASLVVAPSVFVYGTVFGGLAVQAGVGTLLGGLVADPARWGLDFAFPAVFLALAVSQLHSRADWLAALVSAVLALGIALVLPGNWHIVITGVGVSTVGALVLDRDAA